jgi:hypothetical protein
VEIVFLHQLLTAICRNREGAPPELNSQHLLIL